MTPESRKDQLFTEVVGDELLIYDERANWAHLLNPTAALVWRRADGERSVSDLASELRESLGAPGTTAALGEDDSEELVRIALQELDRVGLLTRALPVLPEPTSRRQVLAVAVALVPVVASIVVPMPAAAQSVPSSSSSSSSSSNPFAVYNGLYSGTGTPSGANGCGLSTGPVTLNLNLAFTGIGTLAITHVYAATTFNTSATVTSSTSSSVNVSSTGPSTPPGFSSTNTLVFNQTGPQPSPITVSGSQNITGPAACNTPVYLVNGVKSTT